MIERRQTRHDGAHATTGLVNVNVHMRPASDAIKLLLGLDLVRTGQQHQAAGIAQGVIQRHTNKELVFWYFNQFHDKASKGAIMVIDIAREFSRRSADFCTSEKPARRGLPDNRPP